jgi:D-threo-aldose 1-dehydrogenase
MPTASEFRLPTRRIGNTSLEVTVLGLGCAAIGNLYRAVSPERAAATLGRAWQRGVRYFDTAPYYGHGLSEQRLGRFLDRTSAGELVVSTKVGRTLVPVPPGSAPDCGFVDPLPNRPVFDYTRDAVKRQVESSLARLGIDRLGMLLVHDLGAMTHGADHPQRLREALDGALPALHELKAEGVVAAVGLGVNEASVCLEVLAHADLDVVLLAGRYTLLEQTPVHDLLPRCVARQVSVIVGGPFNSGVLAGDPHYDYGNVPRAVQDRVARLAATCTRHDVALPAAALQFPLAHPAVAAVIPGARVPDEVTANLDHLQASIPAELWADLREQGLIDSSAPLP